MTENIDDINVNEVVLFETERNVISEKYDDIIGLLVVSVFLCVFVGPFVSVFGTYKQLQLHTILLISYSISFVLSVLFSNLFKNKKIPNRVRLTNQSLSFYNQSKETFEKIPINEIRHFSFSQGIVDRKVNCADIKLHTETTHYCIDNINNYKKFCIALRKAASPYLTRLFISIDSVKFKFKNDEMLIWENVPVDVSFVLFFITFMSTFIPLVLFFCFFKKDPIFAYCCLPIAFFSFLIWLSLYIESKKKDYSFYMITNKHLIFMDKDTNGVCKYIPLETIENCCYVYKRKGRDYFKVITEKMVYEISIASQLDVAENILKNAIRNRKNEISDYNY